MAGVSSLGLGGGTTLPAFSHRGDVATTMKAANPMKIAYLL